MSTYATILVLPMISPLTESTKQTSKRYITKDIEIENRLKVTRGERGGDNVGKG